MGDYNIDLLKYEHNCATRMFLDMMYSHGLYPLINKPTRITQFTATIIDNVFTNNITHETVNGIITTDISDHLPVFTMCNGIFEKHTTTCKSKFKRVRQISDTRIADLNLDLSGQNWDCIMSSNDVHTSYKTFVNLFTNLYDKHRPCKEKRVYNNDLKPWFTKCLKNACKKKNRLYRRFLSHRSLEKETRYKLYKNKLPFILRMAEKNYYSKLLQKHKNDVKGTRKQTPTPAIYGDTGRFPLIIRQHIKAVKYWCRILDLSQNHPVRNAYNMLLELDGTGFTNWCSRIRSVLELTGLDQA